MNKRLDFELEMKLADQLGKAIQKIAKENQVEITYMYRAVEASYLTSVSLKIYSEKLDYRLVFGKLIEQYMMGQDLIEKFPHIVEELKSMWPKTEPPK